jgi:hypothetical protein
MVWFLGGGISMVFVLVFGLLAVASAGRFAWSPAGRVDALVAQGVAVLLASGCGVLTDITAVVQNVTSHEELAADPQLHLILLVGLGESLAPAVLGLALIAVQALLVSLGLRRRAVDS